MELILEIVMELYLGMAEIIVPDGKLKGWQKVLLQIACIVVSAGIFICLLVGIMMLVEEGGGTLGIALTSVGGALLVIQSVIFVIVVVYKVKAEKAALKAAKASGDEAKPVLREGEPKCDNFDEVISSDDDLSGVR